MARYELTVTAVTKESRTGGNGDIVWGCKEPNGRWANLHQPNRPQKGFMVVDLLEKPNGKGGVWRDAYPLRDVALQEQAKVEAQPEPSSTQPIPTYTPPEKPSLNGVLYVIKHVLAAFPDAWQSPEYVQAQRAINSTINTVLMAYFDGRLPINVNDPVPDDVRQMYADTDGWEEHQVGKQ